MAKRKCPQCKKTEMKRVHDVNGNPEDICKCGYKQTPGIPAHWITGNENGRIMPRIPRDVESGDYEAIQKWWENGSCKWW